MEKTEIKLEKGLNEEVIKKISSLKREPEWMTLFRLKAYEAFTKLPMPNFGPKLDIDFDSIHYYKRINDKVFNNWDSVRCDVKNTFDDIGIISAEKEYLGGVTTQFESEVIYHNMLKELIDKNVIFCDTDTALKEHPE